jgi:ketosteroid isomerase-like protein
MSSVTTTDPRLARLLASLKSGDGAAIEAICHPDLTIEDPPGLPYGGVYKGFAGMIEVAGKLFAAVEGCQIQTEAIIGAEGGDEFVLRQRLTGTSARTGRPVEMSILEHYTFQDGLLTSIRPYYWDTKIFLEMLGEA